LEISGFLDFGIKGFLDYMISRFQDLWIEGFLEFGISGFQDFRISGFRDFWISRFQDFKISGFQRFVSPPSPHDAMLAILSKSSRRFGFHTTTASTLQNWGEGGGALRRWSFSSQTPDPLTQVISGPEKLVWPMGHWVPCGSDNLFLRKPCVLRKGPVCELPKQIA
jgi:hypothetical protein